MESQFYQEVIETLKDKKLSKEELSKLKIKLSKKYQLGKIPTDISILLHADKNDLSNINLITKPVRSESGVAVVTVMSAPIACLHGRCTFCPGGPGSVFGDIPQSYTGNEPASMRGKRASWDSYLQTFNRLEQYVVTGHNFEKIELIVNGGTFTSFPEAYQKEFISGSFKAMNDFSDIFFQNGKIDIVKFKEFFELPGDFQDKDRVKRVQEKILKFKNKLDLLKDQKINESTIARCIALCLETRPDYSKEHNIDLMLELGTTRVELGIQTLHNHILEKVNRCETVQDGIEATKLLKDTFLKVGFHMMPGLPLSSREMDIAMFKKLFDDPIYCPDALKIYPCMVMPGTELYADYIAGKFKPISTEEAADIIVEAKRYIPRYCRVMRVQRDIPTNVTVDGVDKTNLRQYVDILREKRNVKCQCIRCREPKARKINLSDVKISNMKYESSGGTEIFISADDVKNDLLLGFCRLRIPHKPFRKEITSKSAGIRELHVYGRAVGLGQEGKVQHRGLGQELVRRAEKIAAEEYDCNKMLVISGIGVREYYRKKLGYNLEGPYMSKLF